MAITEVQWSELQRDPKAVAQLVDQGDVRIRRRDGVPLFLTREERIYDQSEGATIASRALRSIWDHLHLDEVIGILAEEFPWVNLLPEDGYGEFAEEFVHTFRACAELGQWSLLAQMLKEWKATAEIHADPVLSANLAKPLAGNGDLVPAPDEVG